MLWLSRLPLGAAVITSFILSALARQAFGTFNPHLQNLLWWRFNTQLSALSPATNCTEWLKTQPHSIGYNFGANTTTSGAQATLYCLRKGDAVEIRP